MKEYKYFIKVTDQNGFVIFDHKSNDFWALYLKLKRAQHNRYGEEYTIFYIGAEYESNYPLNKHYLLWCRDYNADPADEKVKKAQLWRFN